MKWRGSGPSNRILLAASAQTIGEKLDRAKNRPAGFDYMRLVLALAVFALHIPETSYGDAFAWKFYVPWLRPLLTIVLPMFFALSGFLVAGSLIRTPSLISFLGLRVFRIAPALGVEVLLSAMILGPAFTTLPLSAYFSSTQFFSYFLNVIGNVHYWLPGVFTNNPHADVVNGQLWTVPWELRCYLLLGAMAWLVFMRSAALLIGAIAVVFVGTSVLDLFYSPGRITVHGLVLVQCFIAGVAAFRFKEVIPLNKVLFGVAFATSTMMLWWPNGDYIVAVPVAYCTVYLGLCNPKRNVVLLSGDYSYGIFLYGFPIQQALVAAFPVSRFLPIGHFLIALPVTVGLAVMSWWFIEKQALQRRACLAAVDKYVNERLRGRLFDILLVRKGPSRIKEPA